MVTVPVIFCVFLNCSCRFYFILFYLERFLYLLCFIVFGGVFIMNKLVCIDEGVKGRLDGVKLIPRETYGGVLVRLLDFWDAGHKRV